MKCPSSGGSLGLPPSAPRIIEAECPECGLHLRLTKSGYLPLHWAATPAADDDKETDDDSSDN